MRQKCRAALSLAYGADWQQFLTRDYISKATTHSHAMTSLMMSLWIIDGEWPGNWPSNNLEVAWNAWRRTFPLIDLAQWRFYTTDIGQIVGTHIDPISNANTVWIEDHITAFARVLCRCFLYQTWLIATDTE